MEASSPISEPQPVKEEELYDGPKVVPLTPEQQRLIERPTIQRPPIQFADPKVSPDTPKEDRYPAAVLLALDVLSARLLGLVALVTACLIWGGVVAYPDQWRIVAAGVFSALVFLPIVALYWKAGLTGDGG